MKNILFFVLCLMLVQTGCAKKILLAPGDTSVKGTTPGALTPGQPAEERIETPIPSIQEEPMGQTSQTSPHPKAEKIADVFFDYDEALLREDAQAILQKNAKLVIDQTSPEMIQVEGHADARGTVEYNLALGERRAQMVKRYLTALGVEQSRIQTVSFGKESPFCPGEGEDCFRQNRRAHFIVLSKSTEHSR